MARVTIEDCIQQVPNRFRLIILAVQRTRQLENSKVKSGSGKNTVNDKNPVIALREIAEREVSTDDLYENAIKEYQKVSKPREDTKIQTKDTKITAVS